MSQKQSDGMAGKCSKNKVTEWRHALHAEVSQVRDHVREEVASVPRLRPRVQPTVVAADRHEVGGLTRDVRIVTLHHHRHEHHLIHFEAFDLDQEKLLGGVDDSVKETTGFRFEGHSELKLGVIDEADGGGGAAPVRGAIKRLQIHSE